MTESFDADVLIVGSGIMGATVAAELRRRRPTARILMVEAGTQLPGTEAPGMHLHDTQDGAVRESYNAHAAAGTQSMYVGAAAHAGFPASPADAEPGLYTLGALGHDGAQFPAAAVGWNVGGMGAHWTAACPTPWGTEIPDLTAQTWEEDLALASEHLRVTPDLFGPTPAGRFVLDRMATAFAGAWAPGRGPQTMPMAVFEGADGRRLRVGPAVIFPPIAHDRADPHFRLLDGRVVTRVLWDGDTAVGVAATRTSTGEQEEWLAERVVVCADPLRTPQLLWASGVRDAAVGRGLNEHAFIAGRVLVPESELSGARIEGLSEGEWMTDSLWMPHSGPQQPGHWQVSVAPLYADDLATVSGVTVGISVYVPTAVREENRLVFSDEPDAVGLPSFSVEFSYDDEDEGSIARAMDTQRAVMAVIGGSDGIPEQLRLAAGSSLHASGTTRMSRDDDGSGVCDANGRVWRRPGLFVAGASVLPTPIVGNVTLAACTTAVRVARAVAEELAA